MANTIDNTIDNFANAEINHPMKTTPIKCISVVVVLAAVIATSQAAVVYYDGTAGNGNLDVSYNSPGGTAVSGSTGNIVLTGGTAFVNSAGPTPVLTSARYYGGTIAFNAGFTGGGGWYAAQTVISFLNSGTSNQSLLTLVPGTYWNVGPSSYDYVNGGNLNGTISQASPGAAALPTTSTFNFVMKFVESGWGVTTMSLFLGSNATALTEGTPDYSGGVGGITGINQISIGFNAPVGNTSPSSLTASNMFGADTWTPVGAVPEPTTWALLAFSLTGVVVFRRRRLG